MKYHNLHIDESAKLQHIANHLIIQSSALADVGLYHGKTGLVLFFAHYAKYAEAEVYDKFAEELLDEILSGDYDKQKYKPREVYLRKYELEKIGKEYLCMYINIDASKSPQAGGRRVESEHLFKQGPQKRIINLI